MVPVAPMNFRNHFFFNIQHTIYIHFNVFLFSHIFGIFLDHISFSQNAASINELVPYVSLRILMSASL